MKKFLNEFTIYCSPPNSRYLNEDTIVGETIMKFHKVSSLEILSRISLHNTQGFSFFPSLKIESISVL